MTDIRGMPMAFARTICIVSRASTSTLSWVSGRKERMPASIALPLTNRKKRMKNITAMLDSMFAVLFRNLGMKEVMFDWMSLILSTVITSMPKNSVTLSESALTPVISSSEWLNMLWILGVTMRNA
jgi:hypothetical protein